MAVDQADAIRALYVHVPFCKNICGYCDFYKLGLNPAMVDPTVDALTAELDAAAQSHPLALRTIFFGGGTPTILPPDALDRLMHACAAHRDTRAAAAADADLDAWEFTVEANPATINDDLAARMRAAGVNRVSMGAQSFDRGELQFLDRTHNPAQVGESVATCRSHGIRAINVDLIFGVPGQSMASWRGSLEAAAALGVEHLSTYALTYEHGTVLHRRLHAGRFRAMENDDEAALYEQTMSDLDAAGYRQYEISNFARAGFECRHNMVYWRNEPHLSIGPSACGLVDGVRYKNAPDLKAYVEAIAAGRSPRVDEERLDREAQARETAMLALRLTRGLDRAAFEQRFARDPAKFFAEPIARHSADGLLELTNDALRLTRAGRLLADTVIADFL